MPAGRRRQQQELRRRLGMDAGPGSGSSSDAGLGRRLGRRRRLGSSRVTPVALLSVVGALVLLLGSLVDSASAFEGKVCVGFLRGMEKSHVLHFHNIYVQRRQPSSCHHHRQDEARAPIPIQPAAMPHSRRRTMPGMADPPGDAPTGRRPRVGARHDRGLPAAALLLNNRNGTLQTAATMKGGRRADPRNSLSNHSNSAAATSRSSNIPTTGALVRRLRRAPTPPASARPGPPPGIWRSTGSFWRAAPTRARCWRMRMR